MYLLYINLFPPDKLFLNLETMPVKHFKVKWDIADKGFSSDILNQSPISYTTENNKTI